MAQHVCATRCPLYGKCHCGCGVTTPLATQTCKKYNRVKGKPQKYLIGHSQRGKKHATQSKEHRAAISRGLTGREPIFSPYIDGLIVRYDSKDHRWYCTGRGLAHAKAVYTHFYGKVPVGFHVHHKNGSANRLEDDAPTNLMLLTKDWNVNFMPNLAKGFGIPESEVTKAYLQVEHLLYELRFPEVCKILVQSHKLQ